MKTKGKGKREGHERKMEINVVKEEGRKYQKKANEVNERKETKEMKKKEKEEVDEKKGKKLKIERIGTRAHSMKKKKGKESK